jgi:hypothetical protein
MTKSTPLFTHHQGKAKVLTENLCVLLMEEVDSLRRENFALKRSIGVSVYEQVAADAPVSHDLHEDNAGETRCASTASSSALSQAPSVRMQRRRGGKDKYEEFEDEELAQQRRQRLAKRGGRQADEQEVRDGEESKGESLEQRRDSLIWASDDEDWELELDIEQTRIYRRAFMCGSLEHDDMLESWRDRPSFASSTASSGRESPTRPDSVPPLKSVDRTFLLRAALNMGDDNVAQRPRRCSSDGTAGETDFSSDLRHLWDSLWGTAGKAGVSRKAQEGRLLPPPKIRRSASAGDAERDHL